MNRELDEMLSPPKRIWTSEELRSTFTKCEYEEIAADVLTLCGRHWSWTQPFTLDELRELNPRRYTDRNNGDYQAFSFIRKIQTMWHNGFFLPFGPQQACPTCGSKMGIAETWVVTPKFLGRVFGERGQHGGRPWHPGTPISTGI